ncbi:MAG: LPS export ABC transporter permease LptG [Gammaproteobacteria bacterium]|jgi:lipopolysaccharide export system permease protein|nr:LPS export ABC transporter permease LptG [Gammaproteobacteria bacterium]MBQ0775285.1 LPS export ABC transporter permease LptG [Gammaproteobacteria bacterium]|tara:strand:- start:146014 stop:147075 length:1062 start_codon:yes stop_codon:yes gene_type:complete
MRHLNRYLWRAVMVPSLALLLVLVVLNGLFAFIYELEWLRDDYQALQALLFVVTISPRTIVDFMPMAILLGTLLGLGLLANSGELTVIRAAGVSTLRICWMVMRPALLLLCLTALVGEYLAPYTEQVAQSNRALAESGGEALKSKYGYWHREGDEFIHINAVQPNGVLYGVTRYRYDELDRLQESLFIERAIFQGDHWFMEGISASALSDGEVSAYKKDTGVWQTSLTPQLLSMVILKPEHLALSKLKEYADYLAEQELEAGEYLLAFWQKILQPFATLGMVLIATSFVFGPLRQVTMGLRMTAGIAAGLLFHYGQQFFGQLSLVFEVSPLLAAAVPAALSFVIGMILLQRSR